MLQIKIGTGGGGGGVAYRGGMPGILSAASDPSNFIYVAAIAVLIVIAIVLIVLVVREYNLQKKNKK